MVLFVVVGCEFLYDNVWKWFYVIFDVIREVFGIGIFYSNSVDFEFWCSYWCYCVILLVIEGFMVNVFDIFVVFFKFIISWNGFINY